MRERKLTGGLLALFLAALVCLGGCGKKGDGGAVTPGADENPPALTGIESPDMLTGTPSPEPTPTLTPTPTPDPYEGKKQKMLTGEWIDEETTEHRPFAVMLNNIKAANPQSGIGQADIVYEALTEAGITRFLALYSELEEGTPVAERLGSVRSARHYFVSFADEYDAIFVHFGETSYAKRKMDKLGIDHITGMYGVGVSSFYRDKSIKAPHNAFASLEGIQNAVKRAGFRTEYEEGYEPHFLFYAEDTVPAGALREEAAHGEDAAGVPEGTGAGETAQAGNNAAGGPAEGALKSASRITLGFSDYMKPYFVYDGTDGVYRRYQFDGEHTDYNTGEQLAFKNVIIQFVKEWNIDKNGYQTMEIEKAEGTGWYYTNGTMQPVTWKKDESRRFMRYYDAEGELLVINPGKTYIAVFPTHREKNITVE